MIATIAIGCANIRQGVFHQGLPFGRINTGVLGRSRQLGAAGTTGQEQGANECGKQKRKGINSPFARKCFDSIAGNKVLIKTLARQSGIYLKYIVLKQLIMEFL